MKLLLDEMFPAALAEQLRARGHDVVSVHEPLLRLKGASDADMFEAAVVLGRVVVTENASDFRRLESEAFADGRQAPMCIFTTDRQFPRGRRQTLGQIVSALDALLRETPELSTSIFLRPR